MALYIDYRTNNPLNSMFGKNYAFFIHRSNRTFSLAYELQKD